MYLQRNSYVFYYKNHKHLGNVWGLTIDHISKGCEIFCRNGTAYDS
jgi:hypothetical protein